MQSQDTEVSLGPAFSRALAELSVNVPFIHAFIYAFMHFVCISVYVFEHSFPVMGEIIRDTDVAGERRQAHVVNFKERSKKLWC